jgi:hypothetical protein
MVGLLSKTFHQYRSRVRSVATSRLMTTAVTL